MLSLCSCARRSTSRIFLIDTLFVGIGCPPLFLLTEVADQLIRVSTGAMPARLSPAVRDHRNDCPEIDWIECPQVALNLHSDHLVLCLAIPLPWYPMLQFAAYTCARPLARTSRSPQKRPARINRATHHSPVTNG